MTEVIRVSPDRPDPAAIARAAECLRAGGLVAFPTETVYGLGVHALDRAALRRLFVAKQRPATDPLIVHVASVDQLAPLLAVVPDTVPTLARLFWPGPLTLVLPRSAAVPDEVTAGLDTVAVRVPAHPVARALITAAGIPIAAPSANLFSRPSPTQASHVFDDLNGRIDLIVDGGATTIGVESTVLDLSGDVPTVLRPGAVTVEMLREVFPRVDVSTAIAIGSPMPSPGLLEKHYSPRAPLTLFEGRRDAALPSLIVAARSALAEGKSVGIIAADEDREALAALGEPNRRILLRTIGSQEAVEAVAARLYASLRELDASGADVILVRSFPTDGIGVAVQDRLRRAAAGRIIHC